MGGPDLLLQAMDAVLSVSGAAPETQRKELGLLARDLEESRTAIFVRTAEAGPMIERCARAAATLKEAVETEGWKEEATAAFDEFERSVSKLRSTIMVRTQRAT